MSLLPATLASFQVLTTLMSTFLVIKLEKEEVIREDVALCGKSISHRPYSAIGTVQQSNCLCLSCIDSNLGPLIAGWGCDEEWTNSTAQELKARADLFSDWNHIQMTNEIAVRTDLALAKMEAIERHLAMHPETMTMTDR